MPLQYSINLARIHYITSSYALEGSDRDSFQIYLHELLQQYPQSWIERCLIEVMIRHWHFPPLPRGIPFLQEVQLLLGQWLRGEDCSRITENQFQWITGLTPLALAQIHSKFTPENSTLL